MAPQFYFLIMVLTAFFIFMAVFLYLQLSFNSLSKPQAAPIKTPQPHKTSSKN